MRRDLRKYAQQTTTRLIVGGILLLLLIGDGLIYWRYGANAAALGLICIGAGLVPPLIIILILWGMDWIVKRSRE